MLGAVQKQWLKDTITAAEEPLIMLVSGTSAWISGSAWQVLSPDPDGWGGFTTERAELGTHFAASGKNIFMIAGDAHTIVADDGTGDGHGVSPGNIAYFQGEPGYDTASIKGGPWSAGYYPASEGAATRAYGYMVVTDSGSSISLGFTGYTAPDDTARITLTKNYVVTSDYQKTADDPVPTSDAAAIAVGVPAADVAGTADAVALSVTRAVADAVDAADAVTAVAVLARADADAVPVADSVAVDAARSTADLGRPPTRPRSYRFSRSSSRTRSTPPMPPPTAGRRWPPTRSAPSTRSPSSSRRRPRPRTPPPSLTPPVLPSPGIGRLLTRPGRPIPPGGPPPGLLLIRLPPGTPFRQRR